MRVWITRTQPEADATASRVRALGHEAVVGPVLQVEPLPIQPDLSGISALAFSSRHAVAAFASACAVRDLPVFVTGAATVRAATEAGFARVRSAEGDGRALAELITSAHRVSDGAVLHPAAAEPAFDLAEALRRRGADARSYPAYRTSPATPDASVVALLEQGGLDAVLIHSAKAAGEVVRRLAPGSARRLHAYAISPSVAELLADAPFAGVHVPAQPTEAALLRRLGPATDEARS